jgi:hypothetical protein
MWHGVHEGRALVFSLHVHDDADSIMVKLQPCHDGRRRLAFICDLEPLMLDQQDAAGVAGAQTETPHSLCSFCQAVATKPPVRYASRVVKVTGDVSYLRMRCTDPSYAGCCSWEQLHLLRQAKIRAAGFLNCAIHHVPVNLCF